MASKAESYEDRESDTLQLQLQTAQYELSYERSVRAVECVAKDEEIRKLRFQLVISEDESETLHEELETEAQRLEELRRELDESVAQLEQSNMDSQRINNELRLKTRELDNMKAELDSMQNISKDTSKLLTDKLSYARELSTLKPELEFLKSQVAQHQNLLAEKLEVQRELVTVKVELENEKKTSQRLLLRQDGNNDVESQTRVELEELRRKLQKEKLERERADEAAHTAERELEREKRASKKTKGSKGKTDNAENSAMEELREELQQERLDRQKAEASLKQALSELDAAKTASQKRGAKDTKGGKDEISSEEADELRNQLASEKKARQTAEKELQRAQRESKDLLAVKEEKVKQFREKLKSVKEERDALKDKLEKSTAEATLKPTARAGKETLSVNPRKRAATIEVDQTTLGTPGGNHDAKRTRRSASTMPGEKSTFSITPFLNKTASIVTSSPGEDQDGEGSNSVMQETPTAKASKKPTDAKSKPLGPSATGKSNAKVGPRKKSAVSTLDAVAEGNEENEIAIKETKTTTTVPLKDPSSDVPSLKPKTAADKKKPRKSLLEFASFRNDPDEKKKKRKLGGNANAGLGKTLFDNEDEDAPPAKAIPGKGLFAARSLGKGLLNNKGPAIKGGYMFNSEGFQFSPLKKDRKKQVK